MSAGAVLRRLGQLGPLAMAATLLPPLGTAVLIGRSVRLGGWAGGALRRLGLDREGERSE